MTAIELRGMYEKRNTLTEEMEALVSAAVAETRAMTVDERTAYQTRRSEIEALDETISAAEEERGLKRQPGEGEDAAAREERAFCDFIRSAAQGQHEVRANNNFTYGQNGAIIPTTIANRIITTVQEISPVVKNATMFREKGTLKVPVYGPTAGGDDITVGYASEFTELAANAGAFTSVELTGYLFGSLVLVGKSVINSATIDVVGFVVGQIALKIAAFMEKEALNGTSGKCTGALSTKTTKTAASATAVTADELIDVQALIPTTYQGNAVWVMHPDTFAKVRKLKDANNRYLLQDDITGAFPYRLLGKPVWLSDNMPKAAAKNKAVLYGDMAGLAIKMAESLEIEVLRENYATQHAVGINAWGEMDTNVINHQQLATLTMAAS